MEDKAVMVKLEHVSFAYEKGEDIVRDITVDIKEGENVAIVGANGAGKSTILKTLVGLHMNYTGKIIIDSTPLTNESLQNVREKLGYVFQDSESQLFLSTVYQDVAFGPKNYGYSEQEVTKQVMQALQMVHITHLKDRQVYKLSGGEKKLAAIATILSMNPSVLLLDEPSVALDPRNRRNLITILNQLKTTKIIATHDLDLAWDTCERIIILSEGRIVTDGSTDRILRDEPLLNKYGLELPLSLLPRE